jgi:hypothetical protein
VILLTGVSAMLGWFGGFGLLMAVPLITAGICWWWAGYFTLKRRMTLPSMVLATAFAVGLIIFVATLLGKASLHPQLVAVLAFAISAAGMVAWYKRFRLPFSAFLTGLLVLGAIYALTSSSASIGAFAMRGYGMNGLFDLRESPVFATSTLVFGVGMFLAGMWFDIRDPHRLGRHAATAFWCHLLAAPALVNTVAVTLLSGGGTGGIALLAVALLIITVLALVIDRRSFLTAAIVYIAVVLAWVVGAGGGGSWIFVIIALGALITAIGTWWVQLRAWLMGLLPEFPGKSRLPPYSMPE